MRKGGDVTSNSKVVLPELPPGYADTYVNGGWVSGALTPPGGYNDALGSGVSCVAATCTLAGVKL